MSDLTTDPIINAIYKGIKNDIDVVIEQQCRRAAVILIYSAMDTMAYLNMLINQTNVTRTDFIAWADRYIHFPCQEQLTGEDLYGARCSMLHTYGTESNLSRSGKARQILYMDGSTPIVFNPAVDKDLVFVSIPALRDALFEGIDDFLVNVFADPKKGPVVEQRLNKLTLEFPFDVAAL